MLALRPSVFNDKTEDFRAGLAPQLQHRRRKHLAPPKVLNKDMLDSQVDQKVEMKTNPLNIFMWKKHVFMKIKKKIPKAQKM